MLVGREGAATQEQLRDEAAEEAADATVTPIRSETNMTFEVEATNAGVFRAMIEQAGEDLAASVAAELSQTALISRAHVESEIDLMVRATRTFWEMEPDQAMRTISVLSSRCTEMSIQLHRVESDRRWARIRTMQVGVLLDDLDRQFKIHSRLLESRRQDIDMLRGGA